MKRHIKRRAPLELAREKVQSELKGKTLLRVNYAQLKKPDVPGSEGQFFLEAGWYRDHPFLCVDCGTLQVWTATQQKWWYEVMKGNVRTVASRCRACRKAHRDRKEKQRTTSLAGGQDKHRRKI